MIVRPEIDSSDIDEITQITREAFEGQSYSEQTEHRIVLALRASGALFISLVAEMDRCVVGHIAFSPVMIAKQECGWYGIGPLSVKPAYQGQGVGSALMKKGLDDLRESGANGCVLVGDPEYYTRFGFGNLEGLIVPDVPAKNVLALSFENIIPHGVVDFHPAFWV